MGGAGLPSPRPGAWLRCWLPGSARRRASAAAAWLRRPRASAALPRPAGGLHAGRYPCSREERMDSGRRPREERGDEVKKEKGKGKR